MKSSDIMTTEVHACRPEATLNEAARIMWENDCGCVPVVDSSRRILGIITDRDICMAAYTKGLPISAIRIESVMPEHVYTCLADDSIGTVETIMREHRVRRVPVVDWENRLLGIISLNDLAIAVIHEKATSPRRPLDKIHVAETLAAVCEHRAPAEPAAALA